MKKILVNKKVTVTKKSKILDVIKKISLGEYKFQIVIEDGKLLGTICDGDIRRSILHGNSMKTNVSKWMNPKPLVGHIDNFNTNRILLKSVDSLVKFLPVLDKHKHVNYILVEDDYEIKKTALIMAGGFGKRLGNKTKNTPKPLLKIGNKSILEIILQKLEQYNYDEIFISTFYLSEKIEAFIKNRKSKVKVSILTEKKPMGTAGSLSLLPPDISSPITVINGDVISEIDLDALSNFHIENNNAITLCAATYKIKVPFGVISFNENNEYKGMEEKPVINKYILSGIYSLEKDILHLINKRNFSMPDLIIKADSLGKKIGIFPIYESWKDLGSIKELNLAKKNAN